MKRKREVGTCANCTYDNREYTIDLCPLHAAASELYSSIKDFFKCKTFEEKHHAMVRMEEAIRKAEVE